MTHQSASSGTSSAEKRRVDVVTLFEGAFQGFLQTSFVERAIRAGILSVGFTNPRDFGLGNHKSVDDTPYGGGSGMVMRCDVMVPAIEAAKKEGRARVILLTPQGAPFSQATARRLSQESHLVLVCGRYEGFDERIRSHVDEEISIGDYVLTGGELAAMVLVDACIRLVPGVLGNEDSIKEESHSPEIALLEYPQYTRPLEYRGETVPEVLTQGNHREIEKWRRAEAERRTEMRRPDLYVKYTEQRDAAAREIEAAKAERRAAKKAERGPA